MPSSNSSTSTQPKSSTVSVTCEGQQELEGDLREALALMGTLNQSPMLLKNLAIEIEPMSAKLSMYSIQDVEFVWKKVRTVIDEKEWERMVSEQPTPGVAKEVTDVLECLQHLGNHLLSRYGSQLCNPDVQTELEEEKFRIKLTWWKRDDNGAVKSDLLRRIPSQPSQLRQKTQESTRQFMDRNDPSVKEIWQFSANVGRWSKETGNRSISASALDIVFSTLDSSFKSALFTAAEHRFKISVDERESCDLESGAVHLKGQASEEIAKCLNVYLIPAFKRTADSASIRSETFPKSFVLGLIDQWDLKKAEISEMAAYKPDDTPISVDTFWVLVHLTSERMHFEG